MPKPQSEVANKEQPKLAIEEGSNTLKIEDMVADDKPRPPTKPVYTVKLPNGIIIEDY